ncbi:MAG: histone deacetylase complex protein Sin3, partial [Amphiamblys sp. WSBS2006]
MKSPSGCRAERSESEPEVESMRGRGQRSVLPSLGKLSESGGDVGQLKDPFLDEEAHSIQPEEPARAPLDKLGMMSGQDSESNFLEEEDEIKERQVVSRLADLAYDGVFNDLEPSMGFLESIRALEQTGKKEYHLFVQVLDRVKRGRITPERGILLIENGLEDQPGFVKEFRAFLLQGASFQQREGRGPGRPKRKAVEERESSSDNLFVSKNTSMDEEAPKPRAETAAKRLGLSEDFQSTLQLLGRVKECFGHGCDKYREFLEVMGEVGSGSITWETGLSQLTHRFPDNPDAVSIVARFYRRCNGGKMGKRKRIESSEEDSEDNGEEQRILKRVRETKTEEEYSDFTILLGKYAEEKIEGAELVCLVRGMFSGNSSVLDLVRKYVGEEEEQCWIESGDNLREGPMSSKGQQYGSYKVLDKPRRDELCSGRTMLCHEVLNDELVSVPIVRGENTHCHTTQKTKHEEALYRCEDERTEMEVLLRVNGKILANLQAVQERMGKMSAEDRKNFRLGKEFPGLCEQIYKKGLRALYGDKAGYVHEGLCRRPETAVPVVICRLEQKNEEWLEVLNKWTGI